MIKSHYTARQPSTWPTKSYQSALSPALAQQSASIYAVFGGEGNTEEFFKALKKASTFMANWLKIIWCIVPA